MRLPEKNSLRVLRTGDGLEIHYVQSRWFVFLTRVYRWTGRVIFIAPMPIGLWLANQREEHAHIYSEEYVRIVEAAAVVSVVVMAIIALVVLLLKAHPGMRCSHEKDRCAELRISLNNSTLEVRDYRVHNDVRFFIDRDALKGVWSRAGIGGAQRGLLYLDFGSRGEAELMPRAPIEIVDFVAETFAADYRYINMIKTIDDGCGTLPLFGRDVA